MTVLLVPVGPVRGACGALAREYERRAGRYWKLEIAEVPAGARRGARSASAAEIRRVAGERVLARIPDELEIVALTRHGTPWTSRELACYLEELALRARPGAAFIIGGAFGLSQEVTRLAVKCLSLSAFTLPHELSSPNSSTGQARSCAASRITRRAGERLHSPAPCGVGGPV